MTKMIAITGNTYPVREALKALGARWDAPSKSWMVLEGKAEEARRIVAGAPAPAPRQYHAAPVQSGRRRPCGYPGCRYQGDPLCDDCGE